MATEMHSIYSQWLGHAQDGPRRRDQDRQRGERGWRNGSESHQQPRARRHLRPGAKRGPVHDFPYRAGDMVVGKVISAHNGWRVALDCDSDIIGQDSLRLSLSASLFDLVWRRHCFLLL